MNYGSALAIFAGLLQIAAYFLYILQMLNGKSRPNVVSWTIWFFMIILNAASYLRMTGDWIKSMLPAVSGIMILIIYTLIVIKISVSFDKLSRAELAIMIAGIIACLGWWIFKSATFGNLIFQLAFAFSFIPIIKGVWNDPASESPLAWMLFAAAYFVGIVVVLLRWQGQIQDLVFPINACVLHATVAALSFPRNFQSD